jgi:hypothetical protein
MTEQETMGGMSKLAWLGAEFAVVLLALGIAALPRPVRIHRRPAARPTGGGGVKSDLRCARTAQVDRRCRVDLGREWT